MSKLLRWPVLVMFFVYGWTVPVLAQTVENKTAISEILENSGLLEQIRDVPALIRVVGEELAKKSSDEKFGDDFKTAMQLAFNVEQMISECVEHFENSMPEEHIPKISAFLNSPLGNRISRLERESQKPENKQKRIRIGGRILSELPDSDPERLNFYIHMINDMGFVEFGEALALNTGYAAIAGMIASGQAPATLTDDEIVNLLKANSGELKKRVREQIFTSLAFAYRDLRMSELETYGDYLRSPAGVKFHDVWFDFMQDNFAKRAREFGHRLMVMRGMRKI